MCALCGGGLVVETSPRKRGRVPEYVCARHRANGTCANALHISVAAMNEAVLQAVEEHALTPEAIEQVVQLTERDDVLQQQAALGREAKDVEKRIARLVAAIETGGDAASLVAKLRVLEARRSAIDIEAANLRPVPRLPPTVIENRLAEWRRLLRASTTTGRTILQRILRGRLSFTPRVNEISGVAVERPKSLDLRDRTGIEDIGVEDTFDGDYGRLLERVYVKGGTSPTGTDPILRRNYILEIAAA
jgi:hypothetical protein